MLYEVNATRTAQALEKEIGVATDVSEESQKMLSAAKSQLEKRNKELHAIRYATARLNGDDTDSFNASRAEWGANLPVQWLYANPIHPNVRRAGEQVLERMRDLADARQGLADAWLELTKAYRAENYPKALAVSAAESDLKGPDEGL